MSSNLSLDPHDSSDSTAQSPEVRILYDGTNSACTQEIAFWQERYRTRSPLSTWKATFVEISPELSEQSDLDGQGQILVILPDGQVLQEQQVFQYLSQQLGLGMLSQVARWPVLGTLFSGSYQTWVTKTLPYSGRWSRQFQKTFSSPPQTRKPEDTDGLDPKADSTAQEKLPSDNVTSNTFVQSSETNWLDDLFLDSASGEETQETPPETPNLEDLASDNSFEAVLGLENLQTDLGLEASFLEFAEHSAENININIDNINIDNIDIDNIDIDNINIDNIDIDNIDIDLDLLDLELVDLELENRDENSDQTSGEVLTTFDLLDEAPELIVDGMSPGGLPDLDSLSLLLDDPLPGDSLDLVPDDVVPDELMEELPQTPTELSPSLQLMDTLIESAGDSANLGLSLGRSLDQFSALLPSRLDQTMKVPVRQLDTLSNLIAEMVVSRNSMELEHERVRQFLNNLLYQMQLLSDVGQRFQDLYERSLLENALISSRQSFSHPSWTILQEREFDALEMDHFSEFHLLSQEMIELIVRARESAADIDYVINEPLDYIARHFRQVTTQVQEGLNRARMVPFEQGTIRLPRAIREVSSQSGKEAYLVVEGRDTLVDKVLLEQLYDPLTHLINNAVIHGIESPEERRKMGKDPCGKISIKAFYQGNQTVILVKDDGAGIDAELIRTKALKKGLINLMQAQTWKDIDLFDLIFSPGFSTRDEADAFSGRGVGMDVVKTKIESIRGKISVHSIKGQGTHFTIRLPLTLSIAKVLCCISNRARLAFPMDSVEDMLDVHEAQVHLEQQKPYIQWRDQMLVLHSLTNLLKYNRSINSSTVYAGGAGDDDMLSIVILRTTGDYLALKVDGVEGEKEIVIKQLEGPVLKPPGIAGVTVLSDGHILPIVDVLELAEMAQGRSLLPLDQSWTKSIPIVSKTQSQSQPVVLIVDDSITVRELLSMTFKKGNYRVEQARDGREAWEKLRSGLPCDLIFCDIEMPRMTGLELLEKLQRDPKLKTIPIAMLTSRGADRHRQLATQLGARAYFTKPYLEEMLLEAAQKMLKEE